MLKHYLPILSWLPQYSGKQFQGDLSAGLTVGVMLIPQGMAYAMIAGLPPIYGLYASIVPLLLYAIFGTSRQLAVGPVAMVSLLVAAGVGSIAEIGTEAFIGLSITLALLVGFIQFSLGLFRLGFLVNFLSHPVISGFTSAAALIIGLSQLKHLLGIDLPRSNFIFDILGEAFAKRGETSLLTLGIGLTGIALILGAKKLDKRIPGPLLAVVFGILTVWLTGWHEGGVKIVGEVPKGLPSMQIPQLGWENIRELVPIALTISLVGFMESIAVAKSIQARHKDYDIVPNQELIGLGLANIGGAFFQAFPTTGGFSRTAVNDQAGAKTGLASIISAGLIALTLLFLTPLFFFLPKAILASVIMVAVFGLIDIQEARRLWTGKKDDFALLIATFLGTLLIGIEEGILLGVALSLGMVIYRSSYPHIAELGNIPNTTQYRNVVRFEEVIQREDLLILRLDAPMYFANSQNFLDFLDRKVEEKGAALSSVILDFAPISSVDSQAMEALEEKIHGLRKRSIQVYISGAIGPVRDTLKQFGFMDEIGKDHFFTHIHNAVSYIDRQEQDWKPNDRFHAVQTVG